MKPKKNASELLLKRLEKKVKKMPGYHVEVGNVILKEPEWVIRKD